MAALVVSGAPVSVLIDHGLGEKVVEELLQAGIGTIEKLGAMTPEQLEEISGIGPQTVETIQMAVNSYYAQFEEPVAQEPEQAGAEQEPLAVPPAEEALAAPAEEASEAPAEDALAAPAEDALAAPRDEAGPSEMDVPVPEEVPPPPPAESEPPMKTE
jgi:hypothetical protein